MKLRAARPPRALSGVLASWWPPLVAWLTATVVIVMTCIAEGRSPLAAETTWSRYDSELYLLIAKRGYHLFPCRPPRYPPGTWCGNAGWFPAYPWIVGGLHRLALPLAQAALSVSWLAYLCALVVLWGALPTRRSRADAAVALGYAAFAPGLVYDYAVYPLSLLSFCTVAYFALLQRDRWLAAGIAAAVAALAYPVGLAAAPAGALWLLAHHAVPPLERIRRSVLVIAPTLAALLVFALDQRLNTGRWDAYLLVQRKYHHDLHDPLTDISSAFGTIARGSLLHLKSVLALQTLLVAFVLICVLAELALRRATRFDALIAIWAVAAWLLAHAETNVDTYRGEAALMPVALLVTRLPRPLAATIAGATLLLAPPMTKLYLNGVLS